MRWFISGICVVLLLALISWLTVPSYLKKTLEQQVEVATGRQFKVGEVAFNPFTLTVQVSHFVLYEADKKTPAFSADNLLLKASPASVFRLAPIVREVVLTHPSLQLVRSQHDGQEVTNFSDVIARLAEHPSTGEPLRYSVSNIQLNNGAIHLDDQIAGKQIQIDALTIGLPFLSNFTGAIDAFVEPSLSAKINGSLFELKGRSKPFFITHETSLAIDFNQFDLTQLIAFSPTPLPFKVSSAKFSSNLTLNFSAQKDAEHINLSGTASLTDVAMADLAGAPLFKAQAINVNIHEANLVTDNVALDSLEIKEPQVWAGLNQQGMLNWLALQTNKKTVVVKTAEPEHVSAANTSKPLFDLAHFQLKNGTVHWSDAANATPTMELQLANVNVDAQKISTNEKANPAKLSWSFGEAGQQQVHFVGTVDATHAAVAGQLTLSDLALADYQPYVNRIMAANVSGKLSLQTQIEAKNGNLSLSEFSGALEDLKLQATKSEYGGMSAKKIAIEKLALNTETKQAKIEQIQLEHVQGDIFRGADGGLNFSHMLKKVAAKNEVQPAAQGSTKSVTKPAAKSPEWQADINQIALTDSNFVFGDKSVQPAVSIRADSVEAQLEHVTSKFAQPINMTMRATLNKSGKFSVQGSVAEKAMQLKVEVQNFALAALQPYFTEFLNITLATGSVSTKGQLAWKAPSEVTYQGLLKLANLRTQDKENSDDFLKWKMLEIGGINVALGGQQQSITLGKIDLTDFYARAILSEQGKLNLQNIVVHQQADAKADAKTDIKTDAKPQPVILPQTTATASVSTPAAAPAPANSPIINIGQINFNNGIINYTDNFIKPHYSMRMTGMKGSVGAIHSNVAQAAPINLDGKIDNDAPIAISGSLNPLFTPMLLDIKLTASGVDLPRLTAYSAKYAGYPIIKGKLSLDVQYHIQNNQLAANNTLKIDQLTFGDKVDGPDATHLPVPFVVSLLTDLNGQINLDLPISGTLNDPEFSIGGLIFKVFINLIGKVITSPFSLLAHSFSGGEELAYIEFPSGSAKLTDASKAKLDSLAKALEQHPNLKLDIIGRADLTADTSGLRTAMLAKQIQKSKDVKEESDAAAVDADTKPLSDAERAKAIDKIYSAAKFDKPRNMIGFAKSLPTAEMESLIISNTKISEDDIRALAVRREATVQNYLSVTNHVGADRMFSIAPKLNGDDIKDKGAVTRVDFELKM